MSDLPLEHVAKRAAEWRLHGAEGITDEIAALELEEEDAMLTTHRTQYKTGEDIFTCMCGDVLRSESECLDHRTTKKGYEITYLPNPDDPAAPPTRLVRKVYWLWRR